MACSEMAWMVVWAALHVVALLLSVWGYGSNKWVVERHGPRQVGLLSHAHTHIAWRISMVLVTIALIALALATVGSVVLLAARLLRVIQARRQKRKPASPDQSTALERYQQQEREKKAANQSTLWRSRRDRLLYWTRISSWVAGVMFFVAMIVWPMGLANEKAVPCYYAEVKEEMYHMCTPWHGGLAIYIMVFAQIALVLASCFGGCLKPEKAEKKKLDAEQPPPALPAPPVVRESPPESQNRKGRPRKAAVAPMAVVETDLDAIGDTGDTDYLELDAEDEANQP